VLLGFLQGPKAEVNLDPLLRKRLEVIGSVMRSRGSEERAALAAEFSTHVLPAFVPEHVGAGYMPPLRPVVGATFPFTAISDAHAAMERDENFGKIVLTW
jgi:NADPH:quinone reductase-like Zn-dependent oxidoreductase